MSKQAEAEYNLYLGKNYWLGANDSAVEGVYKWVTSGKPVIGGYTPWAWNQPDNVGGQDCLRYWNDDPFYPQLWDDVHCDDRYEFICEIV